MSATDIIVVLQPDGSVKITPFFIRFYKKQKSSRFVSVVVNGQVVKETSKQRLVVEAGDSHAKFIEVESTDTLEPVEKKERKRDRILKHIRSHSSSSFGSSTSHSTNNTSGDSTYSNCLFPCASPNISPNVDPRLEGQQRRTLSSHTFSNLSISPGGDYVNTQKSPSPSSGRRHFIRPLFKKFLSTSSSKAGGGGGGNDTLQVNCNDAQAVASPKTPGDASSVVDNFDVLRQIDQASREITPNCVPDTPDADLYRPIKSEVYINQPQEPYVDDDLDDIQFVNCYDQEEEDRIEAHRRKALERDNNHSHQVNQPAFKIDSPGGRSRSLSFQERQSKREEDPALGRRARWSASLMARIEDESPPLIELVPPINYFAGIRLDKEVNRISFILSATGETIHARLFLWRHNQKCVVSDVDGTITKSDVKGILYTRMGMVHYTHEGISSLYAQIATNGYKFLYLTARPITNIDSVRSYIDGINQLETKMPLGPVITSPNGTFNALAREVVLKRPEVFKKAILTVVRDCFSENPFLAGFGNKPTDCASYIHAGIDPMRSFRINSRGKVVIAASEESFDTYLQVKKQINTLFPSMSTPGNGNQVVDFFNKIGDAVKDKVEEVKDKVEEYKEKRK
ncbi:ned1 [Acrasis kona]|uniref:Ned1 n=1 Tax=Acrasis kona TaxID=1008807 RepID=A0AAW2ZCG5_9EUKA